MSGLFGNAWLLWFLPLAALPFLLHLMTRYRLRTVRLSTYRFLIEGYVQQRRRLRFLEWLLMMMRTAVVLLIVFALSRPHVSPLNWLPGAGGSGEVVLVIDTSPSMSLRTGGTSSLERARGAARQIVDRLGRERKVTVIAAGARPEVLVSRFASRRDVILDAIDGLAVSAAAANLASTIDHVFDGDGDRLRYVYLITDAHRQRWTDLNGHPALSRLDQSDHVALIDVGPDERVVNLAVSGSAPVDRRPVVGLPVMLSSTVVNTSKDEHAATALAVTIDGQREHRLHLALRPGEKVTQACTVTPRRAGLLRGHFDLPGDAFRDDDRFHFCLNVAPRIDTLIVTPQPPSPEGQASSLFLSTALRAPATAAFGQDVADRALAEAIAVRTVTPDKLDAAQLESADVAVLVHVPLDAERSAMLRRYVESGGGVLAIPGPGVDPATYHAGLLAPTGTGADPILKLDAPVGDPEDESSFASITRLESKHPVLTPFIGAEDDAFATTRLYRYFPIRVAPGADDATALIGVTGGAAVLAEARVGAGRIILAGFGATPDWSNLPLKPPYVPLVLRAINDLRRPDRVTIPAAVAPETPAVIEISDRWASAQVEIVEPEGRPHKVELHRSGRILTGAFEQTGATGIYQVNVLPRAEGAPERLEFGFAVNLDAERTAFEKAREHDFVRIFGEHDRFHYQGTSSDDPMLAGHFRARREVWRWLIGAMFVFVFVELFLATTRQDRAEQGPADGNAAARFGRRVGRTMDRAGIWVSLPKSRRDGHPAESRR
ncbi:MAG: hypothetical protein CMJ18_03840 [Phycisphaeraceae bacterium]|nr:hypothetical protein [Phycisphaeraceae bacterium]